MHILSLSHPNYIKEILTVQNDNFVKGRPLEMAKELLGEGLLTSEGKSHKEHSRILQPAFHRKMMQSYAPIMTEHAQRISSSWEHGREVDILEEMIRMSTEIAGKTLFNVSIDQEVSEINEDLDSIMKLFGRISLPYSEWLLKLPLPGTIRFYKAKRRLDRKIHQIINQRRKDYHNRSDMLSLLLEAQSKNPDGFTDQYLKDEALTLLLTAFDTTSLALTWTWYLLAKHQDVQYMLQEELDKILGDRLPTIEDYPHLEFTRAVLSEAMRLYPPIYLIARQAKVNFRIAEYTIPKKTIVLMSPYLVHRDDRFFKHADTFNPGAWRDSSIIQSSRQNYFPFSMGPRACIGQHYAWLEGVLSLATIAKNWNVTLASDQRVEMQQLLNLRPKSGLKVTIHSRTKPN